MHGLFIVNNGFLLGAQSARVTLVAAEKGYVRRNEVRLSRLVPLEVLNFTAAMSWEKVIAAVQQPNRNLQIQQAKELAAPAGLSFP